MHVLTPELIDTRTGIIGSELTATNYADYLQLIDPNYVNLADEERRAKLDVLDKSCNGGSLSQNWLFTRGRGIVAAVGVLPYPKNVDETDGMQAELKLGVSHQLLVEQRMTVGATALSLVAESRPTTHHLRMRFTEMYLRVRDTETALSAIRAGFSPDNTSQFFGIYSRSVRRANR